MPLEGFYYDPKHGGCLRRIERLGPETWIVHGVYGSDEAPRTGEYWWAWMEDAGDGGVRVDFEGKCKRRRHYRARLVGTALCWDDGNAWQRLHVHPAVLSTRLPRSPSSPCRARRR